MYEVMTSNLEVWIQLDLSAVDHVHDTPTPLISPSNINPVHLHDMHTHLR